MERSASPSQPKADAVPDENTRTPGGNVTQQLPPSPTGAPAFASERSSFASPSHPAADLSDRNTVAKTPAVSPDIATPLSNVHDHTGISTPPESSAAEPTVYSWSSSSRLGAAAIRRRSKGGRSERDDGHGELLDNIGNDNNGISPIAGGDDEAEAQPSPREKYELMVQCAVAIRHVLKEVQADISGYAKVEEDAGNRRAFEQLDAWVQYVLEDLFPEYELIATFSFHQLTEGQKGEVYEDVKRAVDEFGAPEYLEEFLPSGLAKLEEMGAVRRLSLGHDESLAPSDVTSTEVPLHSTSGTAQKAGYIPAEATAKIRAEEEARRRAEMENKELREKLEEMSALIKRDDLSKLEEELAAAKDDKAMSDERGDRAEEAKKKAEEETTRAMELFVRREQELTDQLVLMQKEIGEAEARGRAAAETGRDIGAVDGSASSGILSSPTASRGRGSVGSQRSPFSPTGIRLTLPFTPSKRRTSMSPSATLFAALLTPARTKAIAELSNALDKNSAEMTRFGDGGPCFEAAVAKLRDSTNPYEAPGLPVLFKFAKGVEANNQCLVNLRKVANGTLILFLTRDDAFERAAKSLQDQVIGLSGPKGKAYDATSQQETKNDGDLDDQYLVDHMRKAVGRSLKNSDEAKATMKQCKRKLALNIPARNVVNICLTISIVIGVMERVKFSDLPDTLRKKINELSKTDEYDNGAKVSTFDLWQNVVSPALGHDATNATCNTAVDLMDALADTGNENVLAAFNAEAKTPTLGGGSASEHGIAAYASDDDSKNKAQKQLRIAFSIFLANQIERVVFGEHLVDSAINRFSLLSVILRCSPSGIDDEAGALIWRSDNSKAYVFGENGNLSIKSLCNNLRKLVTGSVTQHKESHFSSKLFLLKPAEAEVALALMNHSL